MSTNGMINALNAAVGMQAANMTQKATIDFLVTKLLVIKRIADKSEKSLTEVESGMELESELLTSLEEIREALAMEREKALEIRDTSASLFNDDVVKAAINEAVEKISKRILEM